MEGAALFEKLGEMTGTVAVEAVLFVGGSAAFKAFEATSAGKAVIEAAQTGGAALKTRVASFVSDEAAALAKKRFATGIVGIGTGVPLSAAALKDGAIVAGNLLGKGYVKFAEFSKQMVNELGEAIKPYLEKLYREGLISLDLSKGKQILNSSGKVIDEAIIREAKEKTIQLVQENKVKELKEYLGQINNKYGGDLEYELKQTVEKNIDNLNETARRTVDTHDLLGGHTKEFHIGRSESWLRNRLKTDPTLTYVESASSFKNEETGNRVLGKFTKQFDKEIKEFAKATQEGERLQFVFETGEPSLGVGVTRGKGKTWDSTKAYVMIVKDNSEKGWHIVTLLSDFSKGDG